jgi:putative transposon-encoded protein
MDPKKYFIPIEGYEMIEKTAGESGNSAYVYLPKKWAGKKVKIISLEPLEDTDH